ncbi:MAG: radical SAM family heme chaperone HemW [Bacilli bacterium]|nr:radical SAM family heme chaperone HemW [Bacilli bacterium]
MNKVNSLYIHIPFCNKICDYCDFTKLQYFRNFAISYLEALKDELKSYPIKDLKTIYVGGGTPTALEDDLFEELLEIIDTYTDGVQEYTFEANPESLSLSKIKMLKAHSVNRVSLGVQTTNDKILKTVNRDHSFSEVQEAIKNLREAGIDNINVDLILGLPHTSEKILKKDLKNILSLDVKHISCYGLTVNPHTVLFTKGFKEPEGDILRKYYDIVEETLTKNGFVHYEVSNWAEPGYQSEHNLTYWRNEQYYGCGLGASGYIKDIRYKNTINLSQYLTRVFVSEKEEVSERDKLTYQIMLNLRTIEGLNMSFVKNKRNVVGELIKEKLLILKDDILIPTYEGMMVLDQIILKLM